MAIQTINSNSVQPLGPANMGLSTEQGDTWQAAVTKFNAMFVELYGANTFTGAKTFAGAATFQSTVALQGATTVTAGTGAESFLPAGNINAGVTTIGSSATNTTQTLVSYSLPANTLGTNGAGILVTAWGRKAGNAAPMTLQLNVGGASINSAADTDNASHFVLRGFATRRAANAQQVLFTGQRGTANLAVKSTSDTSVDTDTITISVQGLDGSAAQSNVLLDGLVIEFFG